MLIFCPNIIGKCSGQKMAVFHFVIGFKIFDDTNGDVAYAQPVLNALCV